MKIVSTFAVAAVLALGLAASSASAQSFAPQIPTPANPNPMNPIATDGSPLSASSDVRTGRSVSVVPPISGYIGSAVSH